MSIENSSQILNGGGLFHNYSFDRKAIPVVQIYNLVLQLETKGFAITQQLEGTGITIEELENPRGRVSYRQWISQLERMLELIGD